MEGAGGQGPGASQKANFYIDGNLQWNIVNAECIMSQTLCILHYTLNILHFFDKDTSFIICLQFFLANTLLLCYTVLCIHKKEKRKI